MPLLLLSSSPISSVLLAHVLYIDVIKRIPSHKDHFLSFLPIWPEFFKLSQPGITCQDYLTRQICSREGLRVQFLPELQLRTDALPDLSVALLHVCCQPDKSWWFKKDVFFFFFFCSKPATVEPLSAHIYFFHSLTCCLPIQQSCCILQCAPGIKNEFPNCCWQTMHSLLNWYKQHLLNSCVTAAGGMLFINHCVIAVYCFTRELDHWPMDCLMHWK